MKSAIFSIFTLCLLALLTGCNADLSSEAQAYCDGEHDVYVCGTNIQVVSMLPGAGFTYYRADGSSFSCPVVAPGFISEECKEALSDNDCKEVCKATLP